MGRYWLHDAPQMLRDAGLDVDLYPGWELRSRSTGGLDDILGIVAHHTASGGSEAAGERYSYQNAADRPIGNMHLRRDGTIVFGAAGAANTQGKGGPVTGSRGTVPLNQGNRYMVAIEAHNNGVGEVWPKAQVDAYLVAIAALCKGYGLDPARDVWTHAGYCAPSCPGRKIDAAGPTPSHPELGGIVGRATWSQDELRRLAAAVRVGPTPTPTPTPPPNPNPSPQGVQRMFIVSRQTNADTIWYSHDGGETRSWIRNLNQLELIVLAGAIDAKTGNRLTARGVDTTWKHINALSERDLNDRMGKAA